MFASTFPKALRVFALISLAVIPIYSLTIPSRSQHPLHADSNHNFGRRENGNPNAAGDLYGLGLRVGAYLQVLGMLLSCLRSHKRSRFGIKLLSASVCVALLSSWTVLVSRQSLSPCEAWLVLSLTHAYGTPRGAAMDDSGKKTGGIAILVCAISVIWQQVTFTWFFATLYRSLPLLGTYNRVWLFAPVDVAGWFRILMLVFSCVHLLWLPLDLISYLNMLSRKFILWAEGLEGEGNRDDDHQLFGDRPGDRGVSIIWDKVMEALAVAFSKLQDNAMFKKIVLFQDRLFLRLIGIKQDPPLSESNKKKWDKFVIIWRRIQCYWGFCILILTVAGVEKIIDYNDLSPQNDLSQPGQMIPLILGIITLIDGASNACIPKPHAASSGVSVNHNNSPRVSFIEVAKRDGFDAALLNNERFMLDAVVRGKSRAAADLEVSH